MGEGVDTKSGVQLARRVPVQAFAIGLKRPEV